MDKQENLAKIESNIYILCVCVIIMYKRAPIPETPRYDDKRPVVRTDCIIIITLRFQ